MLRFEQDAPLCDDRGWQLQKTTAWLDDTEVGYLKVSYIPSAAFKRIYTSPWVYDRIIAGHYRAPVHPLPEVPEALQLAFKKFKQFHVDKPLVDYGLIHEDFRRRGYATALYTFVARQLAEQGFALHASGIQSKEAQALWAHLQAGEFPTRVVRGPYKKRIVLDYRVPRHRRSSRDGRVLRTMGEVEGVPGAEERVVRQTALGGSVGAFRP